MMMYINNNNVYVLHRLSSGTKVPELCFNTNCVATLLENPAGSLVAWLIPPPS